MVYERRSSSTKNDISTDSLLRCISSLAELSSTALRKNFRPHLSPELPSARCLSRHCNMNIDIRLILLVLCIQVSNTPVLLETPLILPLQGSVTRNLLKTETDRPSRIQQLSPHLLRRLLNMHISGTRIASSGRLAEKLLLQ